MHQSITAAPAQPVKPSSFGDTPRSGSLLGAALLEVALELRGRSPARFDEMVASAANAGSESAQALRAAKLLESTPDDHCLGMRLLETLSQRGNPTAMHELGRALTRVSSQYDYDPERGFSLVERALAGGLDEAELTLSRLYMYGIGTEKDARSAMQHYGNWHRAKAR